MPESTVLQAAQDQGREYLTGIMDWITQFSPALGLIALLTFVAGLAFLLAAIARLRRRRLFAAGGHSLFCVVLLALGIALAAAGLNLHTYQRFTGERDIAVVTFEQHEPQSYQAHIRFMMDDRVQDMMLQGDTWQMDARILKWRGPAIVAGLDTQYRLDRISGRYDDIEMQRSRPPSTHALSENPGLDLWRWTRRYERWLPWIDARYGSATYLPMRDGASYQVSMTQTGLIARPMNAIGRQAIDEWH